MRSVLAQLAIHSCLFISLIAISCGNVLSQCYAPKIPDIDPVLTNEFANRQGALNIPMKINANEICYVNESFSGITHQIIANNKIDQKAIFSTKVRAEAVSVFDGLVSRVLKFDDQFAVLIRHGKYLSVYSNLEKSFVEEGQEVIERQALGLVKTINSESILNFEIWLEMNRLDPSEWLFMGQIVNE